MVKLTARKDAMLAYDVKTATEHRQRWAAAVVKTWDFRGYIGEIPDDIDRPGLHPENVFDFHDGLRLIVSQDLYDVGEHLHVSASLRPGSPLYQKVERGKMKVPDFALLVRNRVQFVGGADVTLCYLTEEKGVPHFFEPELPRRLWPIKGLLLPQG